MEEVLRQAKGASPSIDVHGEAGTSSGQDGAPALLTRSDSVMGIPGRVPPSFTFRVLYSLLSLKERIAKTRPKTPSKRTKPNLDIAPSCPFGE